MDFILCLANGHIVMLNSAAENAIFLGKSSQFFDHARK